MKNKKKRFPGKLNRKFVQKGVIGRSKKKGGGGREEKRGEGRRGEQRRGGAKGRKGCPSHSLLPLHFLPINSV